MKNAPKHTPGPWIGEDYFVFASNTLRIADCDCDDQDMPESEIEANTHLIAAAPAMYEALKRLHDAVSEMVESGQLIVGDTEDRISNENYAEIVAALRQSTPALAQADGRTL